MTSGLKSTGRKRSELDAQFRQVMDEKACVTSCGICGQRFDGSVLAGREWAAKHRAKHHPDARQTRRRRGHLMRFTDPDTDFRAEGIARAAETARMLARRNSG